MDLGKSFSFVFEDENWVAKIIIGGIISIIPIIGWFLVMGYMVGIARNVIRGNPRPLPEWSDFGQMIVDGLYGVIVALVYMLPLIIVACIFYAPSMWIFADESGDIGTMGTLVSCCFTAFAVLYGLIAGWFFIPSALGRYADTDDLGAALRINEVLNLSRANPGAFLVALLVSILAGFLAGFGVILCCIGVLFTSFYSQLVTGHIYGQAYVVAKEKTASMV
jgi:hypothetical protein